MWKAFDSFLLFCKMELCIVVNYDNFAHWSIPQKFVCMSIVLSSLANVIDIFHVTVHLSCVTRLYRNYSPN